MSTVTSLDPESVDVEFRVYSEKNPKVDHKLDLTIDLFPSVYMIAEETGIFYKLKWERRIYAGDRLDAMERLIRQNGRQFFKDKIVKLTAHREHRAQFFKPIVRDREDSTTFDLLETNTIVHKIKRYNEVPPYDLYLFEITLYHKNMVQVDLNIVPMDKLPEALSAEHLA